MALTIAKSYDYIIVGGGSAGCVLANRLSKNPDCHVLLVEAGGNDRNILYKWPAGFAKTTKGIGSWGWSTIPQKHMKDRVFWFTLPKVIGGGSTINAQIYTRGNRQDFDAWAQMGCFGWSYDDVLPYFRKAEDNDTYDNEAHGKGGPMGVSQPVFPMPIARATQKAAEQFGIPHNSDLASGNPSGWGFYQLTQRNARRSSTSQEYLRPALSRSNLTVAMNCLTRRIVLDGKKVTGVDIVPNDRPEQRVHVSQDVLLSAGTVGSARLLQLSGVGPSEHLNAAGIQPLHNLPGVGSNLQDHLDMCVIAECAADHTFDKYSRPHWAALAGLRYLLTKSGPAASSLFDSGGFWYVDETADSPDMQFHVGMGSGIETGIAKLKNGGLTINSAYMRPRSRGTVRLKNDNVNEPPLIDPNYWSDPHDRDMSLRGLRMAREILLQPALKDFILGERVPGLDVNSDEALIDYGCRMAKTDHHPTSTCAMGRNDDSVVDLDLRVHGLRGLRVVDASIMPRIVSSNTNATVIMIAEKAAALILS